MQDSSLFKVNPNLFPSYTGPEIPFTQSTLSLYENSLNPEYGTLANKNVYEQGILQSSLPDVAPFAVDPTLAPDYVSPEEITPVKTSTDNSLKKYLAKQALGLFGSQGTTSPSLKWQDIALSQMPSSGFQPNTWKDAAQQTSQTQAAQQGINALTANTWKPLPYLTKQTEKLNPLDYTSFAKNKNMGWNNYL